MKIAFALIPEKGHINPYIGPAQALQELGHEVVIAAPGDIAPQLERAGLRFGPGLLAPPNRVTTGPELVALIQDPARLDGWIEQLLLDIDVETAHRWLAAEAPDVVVVDPLFYAPAIAAHQRGLPWAAVSNSLNPVIPPDLDSALLRTVRRLSPKRAAIFESYGMPNPRFSGCDIVSPHLTIAFATEAFVGPPPPGVTLAGPSFPIQCRGDETAFRPLPTDRPIIYASFGSQIYHWPEIFQKILDAAASLDAHPVLSIGALIDDRRWSGYDVYRYAPQLQILRHASVFITHGGANSVMEAIAAGVPMLLSPMCNEQFHQAWFAEKSNIGAVEDLIHASATSIAERIQQVLRHNNMPAISATYQTNGARRAAHLLAQL